MQCVWHFGQVTIIETAVKMRKLLELDVHIFLKCFDKDEFAQYLFIFKH